MKALALMTAVSLGLLCQPGIAAQDATPLTYEVKQGDSLAAIARAHGVSATALASENGIKNPAMIQIGQKLRIPSKPTTPTTPTAPTAPTTPPATQPASAGEHVVASGDTLYHIARASGTTVAKLVAANPGVDAKPLKIGQKLKLPAGSTPKPTAATAATAPTAPTTPAATASTTSPATPPTSPATATPPTTPASTAATPNTTNPPATGTPNTQARGSIKPSDSQASQTPTPPTSEPAPPAPGITLIKLTQKMSFAEFAAAHNTTVERLNALNGWNLPPGALLAPESEFWVPK